MSLWFVGPLVHLIEISISEVRTGLKLESCTTLEAAMTTLLQWPVLLQADARRCTINDYSELTEPVTCPKWDIGAAAILIK